MSAACLLVIPVLISVGTFNENELLWNGIDAVNSRMASADLIPSDKLEDIFRETIDTAFSAGFREQIDDLEEYAFINDRYDVLDGYVMRAAPAIMVLVMGESTSIGVDALEFLLRSPSGTESRRFFELASEGFYADGEFRLIGTATLPAWMEPGPSSAQAAASPEKVEEYLALWREAAEDLTGYYGLIAGETVRGLEAEAAVFSR